MSAYVVEERKKGLKVILVDFEAEETGIIKTCDLAKDDSNIFEELVNAVDVPS